MFGFSWYQSSKVKEQLQQENPVETVQDTIPEVQIITIQEDPELAAEVQEPVTEPVQAVEPEKAAEPQVKLPYKDTLLNKSYYANSEGRTHEIRTLANDMVEIQLSSAGAQPFSVKINGYDAYNPEDPDKPKTLWFVRGGDNYYNVALKLSDRVSAEKKVLNTYNFNFQVVSEEDADTVVMRLPFEGGYIQQKYWLPDGEYMLHNELTVVGADKIIKEDADTYGVAWKLWVPRLEKGYKNEKQYSRLDYYLPGDGEVEDIAQGADEYKYISSRVSWFAFHQQFFSAIMTPSSDFANASFEVKYANEADYAAKGDLMHCTAYATCQMKISDDTLVAGNEFYFGPNDYKTLKSYDRHYEDIIPLGSWIVSWFSKWVIIPVFDFLGRFIDNYGIIILILTILIKLLLSPLTIKSYKSTAKMQVLKPEIEKLNEKYPKQEDAMKKQQAMMNLYQKAGVSPMGGCLPMLLQMPILFAMFRFFPASIELRQQSFLWADDLSAYDSIIEFSHIPLLGDHISLFALLMALSMFLYSKISSAQMADGGMPGMKFMSLYLMPIMMFFICNSLSSALSYYYLLSNIITMIMTWYIRKYVVTEDKVRAAMAAAAAKPRKKSKWQLRLEEAQRMQEQMQKERKNRR